MILHNLKTVSGSIAKTNILRTQADTFDKKMFQYAYNPDYTYGLKYNYISWEGVRQPHQMDFILLDKLRTREITGNAAREAVHAHCQEYGDLVKLICNKDLDCGVTATTLNNVFGKGFIPIFMVQLAIEVPIEKISLPMIGQLKYNGVRVVAHISRDNVRFITRNGKTFEFPKLKELLSQGYKCYDKEVILDGELTYDDSKDTNHTGISGVVNSAIRGTPIKDIRNNIVFNVFDFLEASDFFSQVCKDKYSLRFTRLENFITCLWGEMDIEDTKHIQVAKSWIFNSHDDIQDKFNEVLLEGYEGLICKSHNHLYTYRRTDDWIKLKDTKSADMHCIAANAGDGTSKYADQIGSLTCIGVVEGRNVKVNVGSGLSDTDREKPSTDFVGHIVEIHYNDVIRDKKTGDWSLFLPRFITVRGDL